MENLQKSYLVWVKLMENIYILFFIIHNNNKITPISVIFDLPERWKALE